METRNMLGFVAAGALALPAALSAIDTDKDGLDDSVETGTGVYVSPANTGTKPDNPDSDGDGAGDWYEVHASFTDPTSPRQKPNVPYPLPAPDSSPPAADKPVKVFILSGQSNMVGHGNISPLGTAGTLESITRNEHKFPNLRNGTNWSVRNDVHYRGVVSAMKKEPLKPGQGTDSSAIGPELGFGHVMGYHCGEPVLIIKASEGGKSLGGDFLPPGSLSYSYGSNTYAGYGQSPVSWPNGTLPVSDPNFYGGILFDRCFRAKANWSRLGASLPEVANVTSVLDNFATEYPAWAAQGFVIAGFAWFHGWNDGLSYMGHYAYRYEQNMAQFIRQIRAYYEGRYPGRVKPKAPFVVASAAFEGLNEAYYNQYPTRRAVLNAQLAVGNAGLYPEFAGNVKSFDARGYWRDLSVSPVNQGYHYHRNAETYMLVGDALGRGMIELLNAASDYVGWAAKYPGANLADPNADLDGDGLRNDEERIWGLDPTKATSRDPYAVPLSPAGVFSYTRRARALTELYYTIWTSTDLAEWTEDTAAIQTSGPPAASAVETVTVTLGVPPAAGRLFVRVRAAE
ncbi:MAG: sialate O-acetylesterase [Luteolibacter sp.]